MKTFCSLKNLKASQINISKVRIIWEISERLPLLDATFFFGAGASAAFGIPKMKKMTTGFEQEIKLNGSGDEQDLFAEIVQLLKKDLGSGIDIEAIFS